MWVSGLKCPIHLTLFLYQTSSQPAGLVTHYHPYLDHTQRLTKKKKKKTKKKTKKKEKKKKKKKIQGSNNKQVKMA